MLPTNAVQAAQQMILPYLQTAQAVLDATAGKGNDTLFLAKNTPPTAAVWAFDIQEAALAATGALLAGAALLEKVRLIRASHSEICRYIDQPLDAVMFNLGYLPGGDHNIITQPESTVEAVRQAVELLRPGGMMTIVVYPGHAGGKLEEQALTKYLAAMPQRQYSVLCWQMVNQINNPPLLYAVEKRREHKR